MSGTSITTEVDISRSPHDVFGYLADMSHLPEWQPDVRQAEYDEPATVGVGSRGRELRHIMGSDRWVKWEVTDYDPDRHFGVRGLGPVQAHITIDLTPTTDGTGTHLKYDIHFKGQGFGKLIAPLAQRGTRKDLPAILNRLKHQIEESP